MKIAFLVSSLQFGGAERVATTLSNAWCDDGHSVSLYATYSGRDPCFFELDKRVKVVYLADPCECVLGKRTGSLARFFKLKTLLRRQQPDVVISFLPSANVMAILATMGTKFPVIISERTDPEFFPQPWIWRFVCKHLYQYATALTVQTEAVAAKVNRLFNNVQKVHVMANPLTFQKNEYVRSRFDDHGIIVCLGRLTEGKQTEHVIRSFAGLAEQFPQWRLLILGDGPQRAALERLTNELGCQRQVEFCGDTKQPWLQLVNADVFAMASRFEGFPNALLEALGLGVASVVYDCPSGPAEISEHGRIATLVPLNDEAAFTAALRRLLEDAEFRRKQGELAAATVHEKYSLSAIVRQWDQLFKTYHIK